MPTHHHFSFVCPNRCSKPLVGLKLQRLSGAVYLYHSVIWRETESERERREVEKTLKKKRMKETFHNGASKKLILPVVMWTQACGSALCEWKEFVLDKQRTNSDVLNRPVTNIKTPFAPQKQTFVTMPLPSVKAFPHKM